ncbi:MULTISPECIES: Cys-tRNA(Pro) deacylase [Ureibacillus]|uniref:Cys-tRNA(Pro)/Cys-tRNA(Cys) deacylase n=1 Tax=Ureibacillus thermosphaericus TaxID=51173 RepID=A0A840PRW4_URETH|nr:Cys-tRNA(Pro) deacylase [Ureibacillus thermosphaericus]MBB5147894.1 Cys-tRNA(Pro)/Cys-tRNA(Cys) deacylase [Ureibacillus thermosphaericus]NKZ30611.1 Cys-tRNA(Pro) deacylase [Ureibacillus thermosphaericus]
MAKKKIAKTNAIRLLDLQKVPYQTITYETAGAIDGVSVAQKIGHPANHVYKTLVTTAGTQKFYVFVIPVEAELDLKAAARVAGEKKVEMLPLKDLLATTGYIRGGCSPIGMKKLFPTFIEHSAKELDYIIVSGGKIGLQIQLAPNDLANVVNATFVPVTKP